MFLEKFFAQEINFDLAMKPFTWQHGLFILLAIFSVVLTLRYAERIHQSKHETKVKIIFGLWVFSLELLYHIHYWMHGLFSFPMHMCSLGAFLSIFLLFTNSKRAFQMLFLIGVTGGFFALIIPDTLGYPYYNIRYYLFPLMHMNILIVPLYFYKAYNYRIDRKSIYITFAAVMALMPLANFLNNKYDRNYLFIGEKPRIFAAILPDFPYYLFIGFGGLFIVFNVLYLIQQIDEKDLIKNYLIKRRKTNEV